MQQYTIKFTEDNKFGNQYDVAFGDTEAIAKHQFYYQMDITGRLQNVHHIEISETTEAESFFFSKALNLELSNLTA